VNEMSLAESTPFAAHDIDCRAVDTTTFASPSSLVRDVWQCDLFPSGALFRSSAWDLAITDVAQSVSALTEQLQASMATMVTSLRPYELPRWLISGAANYEVETTTPEEDRRLYALAAVQRLQRLLGLSQEEVAAMVGVSRPSLWNWEQGRTPQERSLRRLTDVVGAVDLLVDAMGGEAAFDLAVAQNLLGLDEPVIDVLLEPGGPGIVLDRLFEGSRAAAPMPSLLPSVADLLDSEDSEIAEDQGLVLGEPAGERRLRVVTRRTR
jgi:transcriptional regulator with XRE-family HTH domain